MKANAFDLGKGFAPKVDVDLWVDARGKHKGGMSIGEEYYETDRWSKKEDAINELKGCWESVKEKVEKAFNDIGKEE